MFATQPYRRICDDHRKPPARYGAMWGARVRATCSCYTTLRDTTHARTPLKRRTQDLCPQPQPRTRNLHIGNHGPSSSPKTTGNPTRPSLPMVPTSAASVRHHVHQGYHAGHREIDAAYWFVGLIERLPILQGDRLQMRNEPIGIRPRQQLQQPVSVRLVRLVHCRLPVVVTHPPIRCLCAVSDVTSCEQGVR